MPLKAVVLSRGGLASTVLAFLLGTHDPRWQQDPAAPVPSALRQTLGLDPAGYGLHLVTILEGQQPSFQARHAARLLAGVFDATHEVLDADALPLLPLAVARSPQARLFTLASAAAVRLGATVVAAGPYLDGPPAWPAFVAAFNQPAARAEAALDHPSIRLLTPLAGLSLTELLTLGVQLGVPFEATWSCAASDGLLQCGRCAPCMSRRAAFLQAGVPDRTCYRMSALAARKGW
jgi:hypothetical protein